MDIIRSRRGLASLIARTIGRAPSTVSLWRQVPVQHVAAVHKLTGLPKYKLRPDVFPAPNGHANGAAKPKRKRKAVKARRK